MQEEQGRVTRARFQSCKRLILSRRIHFHGFAVLSSLTLTFALAHANAGFLCSVVEPTSKRGGFSVEDSSTEFCQKSISERCGGTTFQCTNQMSSARKTCHLVPCIRTCGGASRVVQQSVQREATTQTTQSSPRCSAKGRRDIRLHRLHGWVQPICVTLSV